jgi:hypothetical protein
VALHPDCRKETPRCLETGRRCRSDPQIGDRSMAALHRALLVHFLVAAFSTSSIHAQQSVALSSGGGDFPPLSS